MSINPNNTTLELEVPETIKLIADIVSTEMGLPKGAAMIYNQKRRLPTDDSISLDVQLIGQHFFSVRRKYVSDPESPDLREIVASNAQEILQLELFGYGDNVRLRKQEMVLALAGTYAVQVCERWAMKIGRIPTNFVDASEVEGSRPLLRFICTFNVLRGYSRIKAAPTYSQFDNPPRKLLIDQ